MRMGQQYCQINTINGQGRWQKNEHILFLRAIIQYGKDWKQVQKIVGSRSGSQIRSHAQKFFLKLHKFHKKKIKNKQQFIMNSTQKEILSLFTTKDITTNTPIQLIQLIRKRQISINLINEIKQIKQNRIQLTTILEESKYNLKNNQNDYEIKNKQNNILSAFESIVNSHESQQESYLVQLMKQNINHFILGNNFQELIDFGKNNNNQEEEQEQEQQKSNKRKRSFIIFENQSHQEKQIVHQIIQVQQELSIL